MNDKATKQLRNQDGSADNWQQETDGQESGRTPRIGEMSDARWNELRSLVKQRWSQLTEDDLQQVRGDLEQLCNLIQQQTGQNRQSIEAELQQLIDREPESEGSASMH